MFSMKFRSTKMVRLTNGQQIRQPGEWLDLIHEANRVEAELFGEPLSTGDWWAGGSFEEYADARVIHHGDRESTSVVALTDRGDAALTTAFQQMRETQ